MSQNLRVVLGDVRHNTFGRHSNYVPVGIGYIAAYLIHCLGAKNVDIRLFVDPNAALKTIAEWQPHVVGFSNYLWNARLSYRICSYAKEINEGTLCVLGGPNFPAGTGQFGAGPNADLCQEYLAARPAVDFHCYSDGEPTFAHIVQEFIKHDRSINELRHHAIDGAMSLDKETKDLLQGNPITRIGSVRGANRDIIPSPYLLGLLDEFLDGSFIPALETQRGCPFECTFCEQGLDETRMAGFSLDRICDELDYLGNKLTKTQGARTLAFHDSNWGMYKGDFQVAEHLETVMDKYDWPQSIEISTPKNKKDRLFAINERLKNRVAIGLSQQSMNVNTLEEIKRTNYTNDEYIGFVRELQVLGKSPVCELIVPLPYETEKTYFESVRFLLEAGVNIGTYTLMMLPGSYLGSREAQKLYSMTTKYRVLARNFGQYEDEQIIEVEPVCVQTSTMSYDSYLRCRRFSFIIGLFSFKCFDIVRRNVSELGISYYDYVVKAYEKIKKGGTILTNVFEAFSAEAESELFNSPKQMVEHFSSDEHYGQLLTGEVGDNLLRKYAAKAFAIDIGELYAFAYDMIQDCLPDNHNGYTDALESARLWATNVNTVNSVFTTGLSDLIEEQRLELDYDVDKWYRDPFQGTPLWSYKNPVTYRIYYPEDMIVRLKHEVENLFGSNTDFIMGKFLHSRKMDELFRECVRIE